MKIKMIDDSELYFNELRKCVLDFGEYKLLGAANEIFNDHKSTALDFDCRGSGLFFNL